MASLSRRRALLSSLLVSNMAIDPPNGAVSSPDALGVFTELYFTFHKEVLKTT